MTFKYILLEDAPIDYEESVKWYAARSVPAAVNFIKAVDTALQLICSNPQRWSNRYKNYHELGLKNTPFQSSILLIQKTNWLSSLLFIITKGILEKVIRNKLCHQFFTINFP